MKPEIQEKLQERLSLFRDAVELRTPKRIPTHDTTSSWKVYHTNISPKPTLVEAVSDYAIMEQVWRDYLTTYPFDSLAGAHICNGQLAKVIGMENMITQAYDDERMVQTKDIDFMPAEEIPEYIEDPIMYSWTKVFPRRFEHLTYGQVKESVRCAQESFADYVHMNDVYLNDFGLPGMGDIWIMPQVEMLFNAYQGISGFSKTMRRKPELLDDLVERFDMPAAAALDQQLAVSNPNNAFDVQAGFISHCVMNPKQFGRFFFPVVKASIDKVVALNKKMYIFVEGDFLRYADYFRDIPAGHVAVCVEQDDIYDCRKALPNLCFIGGMPVPMLANATQQECVDKARSLCDELGDSGYIFAPTKMLAYPNDAKPENLKAVMDFVTNYELR